VTLDGTPTDIVERLRAGICDAPCKVKNVMSGCACAEAAVEVERARSGWRGALEERDYYQEAYRRLRAAMPVSTEEH